MDYDDAGYTSLRKRCAADYVALLFQSSFWSSLVFRPTGSTTCAMINLLHHVSSML